jgi:hypothetical protein
MCRQIVRSSSTSPQTPQLMKSDLISSSLHSESCAAGRADPRSVNIGFHQNEFMWIDRTARTHRQVNVHLQATLNSVAANIGRNRHDLTCHGYVQPHSGQRGIISSNLLQLRTLPLNTDTYASTTNVEAEIRRVRVKHNNRIEPVTIN